MDVLKLMTQAHSNCHRTPLASLGRNIDHGVGPQQEEHADANEDDANALEEFVEDEGECVEGEDEEGSELAARQARQRKRAGKRSCTISDSDE